MATISKDARLSGFFDGARTGLYPRGYKDRETREKVFPLSQLNLPGLGLFALPIGGCNSYGVVENVPGAPAEGTPSYSIRDFRARWGRQENTLVPALSGGGTRAATLSYGVLQALRDTRVSSPGGEKRLLDQVNAISSVSGGSFTAAYFGLHGDRIFNDFEAVERLGVEFGR